MNNHRCLSQKSLITIRKWLLEGSDSLSPRFDHHHERSKSHMNKIVKRKRFHPKKFDSKPRSIISWFYEFIKHIFTVYDKSPLHDYRHINTLNNNSALHLKTNSKSTQTETNHFSSSSPLCIKNEKMNYTNAPEIVFAESTCQLIREAWIPPLHDR